MELRFLDLQQDRDRLDGDLEREVSVRDCGGRQKRCAAGPKVARPAGGRFREFAPVPARLTPPGRPAVPVPNSFATRVLRMQAPS